MYLNVNGLNQRMHEKSRTHGLELDHVVAVSVNSKQEMRSVQKYILFKYIIKYSTGSRKIIFRPHFFPHIFNTFFPFVIRKIVVQSKF